MDIGREDVGQVGGNHRTIENRDENDENRKRRCLIEILDNDDDVNMRRSTRRMLGSLENYPSVTILLPHSDFWARITHYLDYDSVSNCMLTFDRRFIALIAPTVLDTEVFNDALLRPARPYISCIKLFHNLTTLGIYTAPAPLFPQPTCPIFSDDGGVECLADYGVPHPFVRTGSLVSGQTFLNAGMLVSKSLTGEDSLFLPHKLTTLNWSSVIINFYVVPHLPRSLTKLVCSSINVARIRNPHSESYLPSGLQVLEIHSQSLIGPSSVHERSLPFDILHDNLQRLSVRFDLAHVSSSTISHNFHPDWHLLPSGLRFLCISNFHLDVFRSQCPKTHADTGRFPLTTLVNLETLIVAGNICGGMLKACQILDLPSSIKTVRLNCYRLATEFDGGHFGRATAAPLVIRKDQVLSMLGSSFLPMLRNVDVFNDDVRLEITTGDVFRAYASRPL